MTCRFILGAVGSGKTHFCLQEIKDRLQAGEKNIYMIVPDQASFIHEQLLAELCGGFCDAQVMGFGRLSHAAAAYLGDAKLPLLNNTGRVMLLAKLLAEHKDELHAFAASAERVGFAESLEQLFTELRICKLEEQTLSRAVQGARGNFADKMHDIMLLYSLYTQESKGSFRDVNDNLDLLAEAVSAGFLDNAAIYIDGFAAFDPIQLNVLEAMFRRGCEVSFCLPIEAALCGTALPDTHYLYKIAELYRQISSLAEACGAEPLPAVCLSDEQGRFADNEELDFIAKHLFPITDRASYPSVPQSVHIFAASSKRQEVSGVGRHILQMIRSGKYRFGDISLCARNIDEYEKDISQVFSDMGIPFFLDGKKAMLNHPLIELLRAALEVAEKKPNYRQIFRYLKNKLAPLSPLECAELENYCLAQGIKFYHWRMKEPWSYWAYSLGERRDEQAAAESLAKINQWRYKGTAELFAFCDAAAGTHKVSEYISALRELMKGLNIEDGLNQLYKQALRLGRAEEAELHRRAASGVYELFSQAEALLGETTMPLNILIQMLEGGFSSLRTAMIPPSADQVFVASVDRSRTPNVRVSFVLGINEGIFPAKMSSGGILNSIDRGQLERRGIELAPSASKRQLAEYYFIYIAMTRASEQLYLSYILRDAEGSPLLPSMAIGRMRQLFPQTELGSFDAVPLELETGGNDSLARMAVRLKEQDEAVPIAGYWQEFFKQYAELPEYKNNFEHIMQGLHFCAGPAPLKSNTVKKLFSSKLYSSVSRLEAFKKCPLAYFAGYTLRLRRRNEYKLQPPDLGQLFHAVTEKVCRKITLEKIAWESIDEERASALIKEQIEALMPDFMGNIFASGARLKYLQERFILTLTNALLIMREQMLKGDFRQIGWEITFGRNKVLPCFDIPLPNGCVLRLSGCIDRLDAAVSEDKVWLRIIDYKSGNKDLRIQDVYSGLSLQLLIYLQVAVLNSERLGLKGEPHAAGGFYFTFRENYESLEQEDSDRDCYSVKLSGMAVQDPEAVRLSDREINGSSTVIPVRIKSDGSFAANSGGISEEDLLLLQKHLINMLERSAMLIYDGTIKALPDKRQEGHCRYCDFKSFCAFDFDALGENEEKLSKNDVLERLRGEAAQNEQMDI